VGFRAETGRNLFGRSGSVKQNRCDLDTFWCDHNLVSARFLVCLVFGVMFALAGSPAWAQVEASGWWLVVGGSCAY
jgi:hypothetical protein